METQSCAMWDEDFSVNVSICNVELAKWSSTRLTRMQHKVKSTEVNCGSLVKILPPLCVNMQCATDNVQCAMEMKSSK